MGLVGCVIVGSVIGLYYYLRLAGVMYMSAAPAVLALRSPVLGRLVIVVLTVLVEFGIFQAR